MEFSLCTSLLICLLSIILIQTHSLRLSESPIQFLCQTKIVKLWLLSNNWSRRQLQTGIHININVRWHTAAINYRNSPIQSHKIKRIARFCILRLLITDKCYAKIADICIWSTTALYQTLLKFKHTLPHAHTHTPSFTTFQKLFSAHSLVVHSHADFFFHFSHSFTVHDAFIKQFWLCFPTSCMF